MGNRKVPLTTLFLLLLFIYSSTATDATERQPPPSNTTNDATTASADIYDNPPDATLTTKPSRSHTPGRRVLQTPPSSCEFNVVYDIIQVTATNFIAQYTLANNREVDTDWQFVYTYVDADRVELSNVTGATAVKYRKELKPDAPIRIKSAAPTPPGTNFTFTTTASFNPSPADGSESLLVQAVNVNGMQCLQTWPASSDWLQQGRCYNTISFFSAFAGSRAKRTDACRAMFCCGFVLQEQQQSADADNDAAVKRGLNAFVAPTPETEISIPPVDASTLTSPQPEGGATSTNNNMDSSAGTSTAATASTPNEVVAAQNTTSTSNNSENIPLVAGTAVVGILLILLSLLLIWWLRRSWKQPPVQPQQTNNQKSKLQTLQDDDDNTPMSPNSAVEGGFGEPLTLRQLTTYAHNGSGSGSLSPSSSRSGRSSNTSLTKSNSLSRLASDVSLPTSTAADNDTLDSVVLYEQLGAGAFGTVYRGIWNGSQPVAVKVLQTSCGQSSRELNSFRQEITVLSKLRHPNIISFYAACTVPPDICIVEELAVGGSLYDKLHGEKGEHRRIPLPYGQLIKIAIDVAEAMHYLHALHQPKIVHRDMKSQNVLLDRSGNAKVCDFGIAKFKDKTFVSTVNGQAGTPMYMAPEIFDNAQVTEKVDIYAYGIVLWEMLTGLVPWAGVTPMQVIYYVAVLQSRPPLPKTCPVELKKLIEECWAEDPSSRPPFSAILQRLKKEAETLAATGGADQFCEIGGETGGDRSGGGVKEGEEGEMFDEYALHSYQSSQSSPKDGV